jgi:Pyridoxal-phosphate dependent enzyme
MTLATSTPVEDHRDSLGLWVKREDLSSPPPGPPFSKMRGVMAHIAKRPEGVIGVLDTFHSQAGHAVAAACAELGKKCVNFYPVFKKAPGPHQAQLRAQELGAVLSPLLAGRSAVIYHQARAHLKEAFPEAYMMPNALKLEESVSETAAEVHRTAIPLGVNRIILPASSGTIAAGVIRGVKEDVLLTGIQFIVHMGYSRPERAVRDYLAEASGFSCEQEDNVLVVDEGYGYRDQAKSDFPPPPWPCNPYYDLKAFRWWQRQLQLKRIMRQELLGEALLWNIG